MSAYPLMLEGASLSAVVVGGGRVALRKVRGLLDAGAFVDVVAPDVDPELTALAAHSTTLHITRARYAPGHLGDAMLVIAATNDDDLNAEIASDARARGKLVNVASNAALGNCVTAAAHRAGDIVVAVTAGGVPAAAARIRDAIARTFDARYGGAVRDLASLRRRLLDRGQRAEWAAATAALVGPDFCDEVESGQLATRIAEWV